LDTRAKNRKTSLQKAPKTNQTGHFVQTLPEKFVLESNCGMRKDEKICAIIISKGDPYAEGMLP
jgi:hypothetical protein